MLTCLVLKDLLPKPDKPNGKKQVTKKKKADPSTLKYILILSSSALRVCDVTRALKPLPGGALKLIKKNKLSYDSAALASGYSRVAVSTAGRIQKLIAEEVFKPKQVGAIVVDSTFLDSKIQNVWDLADTVQFLRSIIDAQEIEAKKPFIYLY